ncbi:MAG: adenosine deaminase [archaeon]|nr:adenosine deaminase [archaeon]
MSITPEELKAKHERYSKEKADLEFLEHLKFPELHYHLDGSITTDVALACAKKQKMKLPTSDRKILKSIIRVPPGCTSLTEFLKHFDLPGSLLQTREGIIEAVYQCQEHCRRNNGIYLEIRFAPQFHVFKGLTQKEAVEAAVEGLKKSTLKTNLILCMMRLKDNKAANLETIEVAKDLLVEDNGVVALDLAGDEIHFPTKDYAEEFALAKKYGIPFTIHAGESDNYTSVDAAVSFGATRIGHGINSIQNENTIKSLVEKNVLLEVCPFSNFCTNCATEEKFPFKGLLDKGVKMCLNTDDLAIIGNHLIDEFTFIVSKYDVTKMQILQLLYNAIDGAFTTDEVKEELRKMIDEI